MLTNIVESFADPRDLYAFYHTVVNYKKYIRLGGSSKDDFLENYRELICFSDDSFRNDYITFLDNYDDDLLNELLNRAYSGLLGLVNQYNINSLSSLQDQREKLMQKQDKPYVITKIKEVEMKIEVVKIMQSISSFISSFEENMHSLKECEIINDELFFIPDNVLRLIYCSASLAADVAYISYAFFRFCFPWADYSRKEIRSVSEDVICDSKSKVASIQRMCGIPSNSEGINYLELLVTKCHDLSFLSVSNISNNFDEIDRRIDLFQQNGALILDASVSTIERKSNVLSNSKNPGSPIAIQGDSRARWTPPSAVPLNKPLGSISNISEKEGPVVNDKNEINAASSLSFSFSPNSVSIAAPWSSPSPSPSSMPSPSPSPSLSPSSLPSSSSSPSPSRSSTSLAPTSPMDNNYHYPVEQFSSLPYVASLASEQHYHRTMKKNLRSGKRDFPKREDYGNMISALTLIKTALSSAPTSITEKLNSDGDQYFSDLEAYSLKKVR